MLSNTVTVNVPTADGVLLGGNMRRRSIVFSSDSNSLSFVNFGRTTQPVAGTSAGYVVVASNPPTIISSEIAGDAIHDEIHGVAGAGGIHMTITEFFDN